MISRTSRLRPAVERISQIDPCLSATQSWDQIDKILTEFKVTVAEFQALDEQPGHWADLGADWHWKVRTYRNSGRLDDHYAPRKEA